MKRILLLAVSLIGFCTAHYFQQTQKTDFNKTKAELDSFKKNLRTLEEDLAFVTQYHKKLQFLVTKGWFLPQNRLIAGEKINEEKGSLNSLRFTIDPESLTGTDDRYSFKTSKITFEIEALLDKYIYAFASNILKNFPGILMLRRISLSRNDKINERTLSALRQHKRPNFVVGEIICEWMAMPGETHEK